MSAVFFLIELTLCENDIKKTGMEFMPVFLYFEIILSE